MRGLAPTTARAQDARAHTADTAARLSCLQGRPWTAHPVNRDRSLIRQAHNIAQNMVDRDSIDGDRRQRPPHPRHHPATRTRPSWTRAGAAASGAARMGTLNVRTLRHAGQAEELAADLQAAAVSVCGLQEVRWLGTGKITLYDSASTAAERSAAGWQLVWSGEETYREGGVGALLSPAAARSLQGYAAVSPRLLLLHLAGTVDACVVVAYAPTNAAPASDAVAFYKLLDETLAGVPAHRMVIVLGDMNAKVGRDSAAWAGIVGGHGAPRAWGPPGATEAGNAVVGRRHRPRPPGVVNSNGRRCLQLCASHGLFVANTFFKHSDQHTASWLSNTGQHWATLDLVLVSRRFRSSVLDTRVLPAATAHDTDHRLVVCDVRLRLKARPPGGAPAAAARVNTEVEAGGPEHMAFVAALEAGYDRHRSSTAELGSGQEEWRVACGGIAAAAQALGRLPRPPRAAPWITQETRQLCDRKRAAFAAWHPLAQVGDPTPLQALAKVAAREQYKALCQQARAAATRDKNAALLRRAEEMDGHVRANRLRQAFQVAAELQGSSRPAMSSIARPDGSIAMGPEVPEVLARHFHATLNVAAAVAPELVAAVHDPGGAMGAWGGDGGGSAAIAAAAAPAPAQAPAAPAAPSRGATTRAATARQATQQAHAAQQGGAEAAADGAHAAAQRASSGEAPTLGEVQAAIKRLRNTAPGADGHTGKLFKLGGTALAKWLHRTILAVWATGVAPQEWKEAQLVPIHKSKDRLQPDNYRGVTLLAAAGKVYVQVLHQRIRGHLDSQLLDAQNGFRPGRGTGDALFCARRLAELARDFQRPLYAGFVDFRKAFDSVHRPALWQLLRARGVAPKVVDLIEDLYDGCSAQVWAAGSLSEPFPMGTGVRQGCPMSPTLFNTFIDFLARLVGQECQEAGVQGFGLAFRVGPDLVPVPGPGDAEGWALLLLYADDLMLTADSWEGLDTALRSLERTATAWGMAINYDKTKVMVFGEPAGGGAGQQQPEAAWPAHALAGGEVQRVGRFKYLGSIMEAGGQQEQEISHRLAQAGHAFHKLRQHVFKDGAVSLRTRIRLYKAVVLPTLLYGAAEAWAPTHGQRQRLDAFHTTCLRHLLRAHRGEGMISNEQLYEATDSSAITDMLGRRRMQWLGHAARSGNSALQQCLYATAPLGRVRRVQGGPCTTWNRAALGTLTAMGPDAVRDWAHDAQDKKLWAERYVHL